MFVLVNEETKQKIMETDNYKNIIDYVLNNNEYCRVDKYCTDEYLEYFNSDATDYTQEPPEIQDTYRVWKHPITNKFMEGWYEK